MAGTRDVMTPVYLVMGGWPGRAGTAAEVWAHGRQVAEHGVRWLAVVAVCGLLVGCDKAKGIFGGGGGAGGSVAGTVVVPPGGSVEATLDAMVLRTSEGVSFRRDIEFPSKIQGVLSVMREMNGVRVMEASALGEELKTLDGKFESRMRFIKGAGQFTMTVEKVEQGVVGKDDEEVVGLELRERVREGKSLYFGVSEQGWYFKMPEGTREPDLESWAGELGKEFPQLLVDAGAHPRAQWFSPARVWRSGDRIVLAGSAVKLLDPFDSGGRLVLVFQGEEAIGGHPCGVFAVEGSYTVKERLACYGAREDAEVTVTAGRIWASLLFPMVMREEYEVVENLTRRLGSGPELKMQGGVKITRARAWAPQS